jgi:hypothetical protein
LGRVLRINFALSCTGRQQWDSEALLARAELQVPKLGVFARMSLWLGFDFNVKVTVRTWRQFKLLRKIASSMQVG